MAPLLPQVQQRVLVLVGDGDALIPSGEEGPRLQRALPRAHLRVLKGRSHALLQVRVHACVRVWDSVCETVVGVRGFVHVCVMVEGKVYRKPRPPHSSRRVE